ncbi:MAG: DUF433 domain-containing protein [Phototrophicaceae bacterium]
MTTPLVTKSTDILGGIAVFYGTRVPVRNLTDYLSASDTIEDFLIDFPTVSREQVLLFLEQALMKVSNEDSN